MRVPLAKPDIGQREKELVAQVLDTPNLSMGPMTKRFEQAIASFIGCKHGIAVNSGTSGLHLLIRALGIGEGDEVITTSFSFVASSNVILYERAVPVYVDIEPQTANLDPDLIRAAITSRTRAILPVDAFGQPARLDEVRKIADEYGLKVIEDSCESLGSEYKGIKAGHGAFAHGAVFAFYPNKQITTGEGGMIVTDDDRVASLCESYRNQGRGESGLWLTHERLGYNYRLDEMSAALGVAQMERIKEFLHKRQQVAALYNRYLKYIEGIEPPYIADNVNMSWFVYVVRIDPRVNRDLVMEYLIQHGVGCRPYFTPIHLQPFYRRVYGYEPGDLPVTEDLGRRSIALPFHNNLTEEEIAYVTATLQTAIERC
jgi:perosamine synthetase